MDKFLEWINKHREYSALTDKSYKKVYTKEYHKELAETKVNTELATYGDAVLKLALCEILWGTRIEILTEEKKKYESDEVLVSVIGKRYDILTLLRFDKDDAKMPKDYDYKDNKHKYIATAIEACLGAMYMDESVCWQDIIEIIKEWKCLIDGSRYL